MYRFVSRGCYCEAGLFLMLMLRVIVANGHGGKWSGVDLFSPSASIFVFTTYKIGRIFNKSTVSLITQLAAIWL